jgi:alpha-L-rhamnosidase
MTSNELGWDARWIEPVEAPDVADAYRPAYHLAVEFEVPSGVVVAARLRCSARGLHKAFLDGQRLGDLELTPGCTAYRSRIKCTLSMSRRCSPRAGTCSGSS